jgi:hypothetical protein
MMVVKDVSLKLFNIKILNFGEPAVLYFQISILIYCKETENSKFRSILKGRKGNKKVKEGLQNYRSIAKGTIIMFTNGKKRKESPKIKTVQ